MSNRLQVFLPKGQKPKQDCSHCATQRICFMDGISNRHIVTNLLVCRLKRGIDPDRTTLLLLKLLRPKLASMAKDILGATGIYGVDSDTVIRDLESATIEQLLEHYVMGEIGYPLHYLFGVPNGVIRRYASTYAMRIKKSGEMLLASSGRTSHQKDFGSFDQKQLRDNEILNFDQEFEDRQSMSVLAHDVNGVIDDGLTLRTAEYRVLRFCLDNMTDAKRPLNGLHIYMGHVLGTVRSRATRLWIDARDRIAKAVGPEKWLDAKNR